MSTFGLWQTPLLIEGQNMCKNSRQARYNMVDSWEFSSREGIRGESTMNLTPLTDQPNGFQNDRTWAVYEKMLPDTLIHPKTRK